MLVATRAIVATGAYAPRGFAPEVRVHQGAEEADGIDALIRIVRDQIARGADWIKFYADFLAGRGKGVRPAFTLDEMKRIVETAAAQLLCALDESVVVAAAQARGCGFEHRLAGDLVVVRRVLGLAVPRKALVQAAKQCRLPPLDLVVRRHQAHEAAHAAFGSRIQAEQPDELRRLRVPGCRLRPAI